MKLPRHALIMVLAVALLASSTLLAAQEVSITWAWKATQSGVTAFRYQLDNEIEGLWTVVDASVLSFTSGPLDASVDHVLFVQQTLDGSIWGPSGKYPFDAAAYSGTVATNVAQAPLPEAPAAEQPAVESQPVAQPEAVAVAPAPVDVPAEPTKPSTTRVGLELSGFAGGVANNYILQSWFDPSGTYPAMRTMILPSAAVNLVVDNMVGFGSKLGLGLKAGVGYEAYESSSTKIHFGNVHALAKLDFAAGDKVSFEVGLGAADVVPYADLNGGSVLPFDSTDINWFYGPVVDVGLRYKLGSSFTIGMNTEARMLFSGALVPYELTGIVRFGLGYWF